MTRWLMHWAGLTSPNSATYLFWSGIGSDAAKFVLIAGLLRHLHWRRTDQASVHEKLDRLAEQQALPPQNRR